MPTMRAEILSIGTELLLGQIVDTNAAYLAGRLALLGIDCLHKQTVGDDLGRATDAFRLALSRTDLVVATGGLRPTIVREGVLRWRTLKLLGIGEGAVEEKLDELVRSTSPTVATYAKNDGVHVRVADKAATAAEADARIERMEAEVRARLGDHVWGVDDETLGGVVGRGLVARGWRLAVADALTAGELARALADAPEAARWLAGALVVPGADASTLEREVRPLGAQVILLVPAGASESELRLYAPDRPRGQTIRYRTPAEARRRALLSGLDLLRRALAN